MNANEANSALKLSGKGADSRAQQAPLSQEHTHCTTVWKKEEFRLTFKKLGDYDIYLSSDASDEETGLKENIDKVVENPTSPEVTRNSSGCYSRPKKRSRTVRFKKNSNSGNDFIAKMKNMAVVTQERWAAFQARTNRLKETEKAVETNFSNVVLLNRDRLEGEEPLYLEQELVKKLKPHQVQGVLFLWHSIVDDGRAGCLLADSMGLGKTLQAIVFMYLFQKRFPGSKALIVAPNGVHFSWEKEFQKLPNCTYLYTIDSLSKKCLAIISRWHECGGILLVNYEKFVSLCRRGFYLSSSKSPSRNHPASWILDCDLCVLDEGHKLRSFDSQTSRAFYLLSTLKRIVLTGYPLQNNLAEYWSMMNFCCPGFLGSFAHFRELYVSPIRRGQREKSSKAEIAYAKRRCWYLHEVLKPLIIRRNENVLAASIPPKYEYTLFVPLTGLQRHLYLETLKGMNFLSGKQRMSHFLAIYILCLVCSIPGVLRTYLEQKYNDWDESQMRNPEDWFDAPDFLPLKKTLGATTNKEYLQTLYSVLSFPVNELVSLPLENFERDPFQSFKLLVLLELVSHSLEMNEKMIIFTRSIPLLENIVNFLNCYISSSRDSVHIDSFHGRTPVYRRKQLIDQFNLPDSPLKVLVLSTGTGGEGISLVAASRVVIFDCSWNPSHDMQAACRAYRYGQAKPVYVYRLVTKNTVEEKMYCLGRNKTELSRWVVENDTREEIVIPELSWRHLNQTRDLVSYVQYPFVADPAILKEDTLMNALAKSQVGNSYPFLMGFFNKKKKMEEIDCYGMGPEYYMIHSICRCESRKLDEVCLDSLEERTLARKEFTNDLKKILHRFKIVQNVGESSSSGL
ncbi:hypothetical protein GpartN1_g2527.t1 [Galdieria partita]|uniref:Uncharacterized protein n=1 Tax=Galdieria partita TaxID=83374 RepID=A0A9C7UPM2_9RHOD|nr:hypothetical protein GpartN1_g2527.t1 [Galdieria partita]